MADAYTTHIPGRTIICGHGIYTCVTVNGQKYYVKVGDNRATLQESIEFIYQIRRNVDPSSHASVIPNLRRVVHTLEMVISFVRVGNFAEPGGEPSPAPAPLAVAHSAPAPASLAASTSAPALEHAPAPASLAASTSAPARPKRARDGDTGPTLQKALEKIAEFIHYTEEFIESLDPPTFIANLEMAIDALNTTISNIEHGVIDFSNVINIVPLGRSKKYRPARQL
jgi:hypothetical protein